MYDKSITGCASVMFTAGTSGLTCSRYDEALPMLPSQLSFGALSHHGSGNWEQGCIATADHATATSPMSRLPAGMHFWYAPLLWSPPPLQHCVPSTACSQLHVMLLKCCKLLLTHYSAGAQAQCSACGVDGFYSSHAPATWVYCGCSHDSYHSHSFRAPQDTAHHNPSNWSATMPYLAPSSLLLVVLFHTMQKPLWGY